MGKLLYLSEPQVPHPVMEITKSTLHSQVCSRYLISKGAALLISHLKWVANNKMFSKPGLGIGSIGSIFPQDRMSACDPECPPGSLPVGT